MGSWEQGMRGAMDYIPHSPFPTPHCPQTLARYDVLLLVVKSDLLAGVQGGNRHAQRDGMVVGRMDIGVRLLVAVANATHPVAHVGHRLLIRAGVGRGLD